MCITISGTLNLLVKETLCYGGKSVKVHVPGISLTHMVVILTFLQKDKGINFLIMILYKDVCTR